jgi:hypothetical protein
MKTEGKKLTIKERYDQIPKSREQKMMFLMEKRERAKPKPTAKERVAERVKLSDAKLTQTLKS